MIPSDQFTRFMEHTVAGSQHILVVEDEEHLAIGIRFNLEAESYRVTLVDSGPAALKVIQDDDIDLIVLDIMLPGMSGYEICESIRASGDDTPVLFLSARTLAEDRARGFEVGADQYMNKPFDLAELLARVKNLLQLHDRRQTSQQSQAETLATYSIGGAEIDFEAFEVKQDESIVRLTPLNMKLLRYFVTNEGRVIPRSELLEKVWGMPGHIQTRAPDQFIRRLRETFEKDPAKPRHFITLRDVGYRFIAEPE